MNPSPRHKTIKNEDKISSQNYKKYSNLPLLATAKRPIERWNCRFGRFVANLGGVKNSFFLIFSSGE